MKTIAFLLAFFSSAWAFAPTVVSHSRTTAMNMVDLANGAMSFDHVCREWRCKYEGDKGTSESLESISKVLDEYLPAIKKVSPDIKVNRLVCGSCLDFKLMMTVPLAEFGPWEEKGFAPEADFLAKIKAIEEQRIRGAFEYTDSRRPYDFLQAVEMAFSPVVKQSFTVLGRVKDALVSATAWFWRCYTSANEQTIFSNIPSSPTDEESAIKYCSGGDFGCEKLKWKACIHDTRREEIKSSSRKNLSSIPASQPR
eukprot:scaffold4964_cov166-Amphora_coffeaeformis.AAC.4